MKKLLSKNTDSVAALNNAIINIATEIGADELEKISAYLGDYSNLFIQPLIEHIEDPDLPKVTNRSAALMCAAASLVLLLREKGVTNMGKVPAVSIAAKLFRSTH